MNFGQCICLSLLLISLLACKNSSPDNLTQFKEGPAAIDVNDGVSIAYHIYGQKSDKKTLVFVHGWSCDQTYWKHQVDYFKKDRLVITIDLAGHGKSNKGSREIFSISSFANDVNSVIDHLKLADYVLLGHSMGTMVVLQACADQNQESTPVVAIDYLFDTLKPMAEEQFLALIEPFEKDFYGVTKQFVNNGMFRPDADSLIREQISNDMASAPDDVAISAIASLMKTDFNPMMETIVKKNNPRFVINADNGEANIEYLENALGFKVNIVPQSNHFFMIEKPHETNSIIDQISESL